MKRFFFAVIAIFLLFACNPSEGLVQLNKNELLLGNGSSELLVITISREIGSGGHTEEELANIL